MTQPQIAIAVTADDKTARGFKSAEKNAGRLIGKVGGVNKEEAKAAQDAVSRSASSIVKSFSAIRSAGSKALGSGGIIGRMGAIKDVGLLARGFGEAAAEGVALEGAAIGVAGALAGAAGVAAIAGAAMWKLSDGWAKGANQMGNMASLIGVSTKGLQEFAGAAERVGVDKSTATGALGSLSQTLNDAKYGRNTSALAMLGRLGIKKLATNTDGTVNIEAMLPQIANGLAAQNSSGRRTAARALGIPEAALAAFTQGGKRLSGDMADYGRNGAMMTDADTKLGRDLTHRDVSGAQRLGRAVLSLQRTNATAVKDVGDAAVNAIAKAPTASQVGQAIGTGAAAAAKSLVTPAVADPWGGAAGSGFGAERARRGLWRGGGRLTSADVMRHAEHARQEYRRQLTRGMSPEAAAAWAATSEMESGNDPHRRQGNGPGEGKYQWGSPIARFDRRRTFRSVIGASVLATDSATQDRFRDWELAHGYRRAARAVDAAETAGDKAAAITRYYEAPANIPRDTADRANVAEQLIRLEINFKNAPAGVSATAKAGDGTKPAISHAFSHQ